MSHRPGTPARGRRRLRPAALLLGLLLLGSAARGGPDYGRPVLPGLDPLLTATRDPRLLGVDRLEIRERIMEVGEDPAKTGRLPDYDHRMSHLIRMGTGVDLERMVTVVESSSDYGLETVFTYPRYHYLFQTRRNLPGGFVYYPPRDVGAVELDIFIDDIDEAFERKLAVANRLNRHARLNAYAQGGSADSGEGLINLTIPIKVPRTLEKIIGRGEKTNIRISGREHISISGETRRSNKFTASERRQNQSWFPTLDMEQDLQINLSGQIGERIKLEVDHNSTVIGADATKIRLYYEGDEDDVIQSIETGDVGLTLPNSTFLGYSSNKSGLFGVKVAGQFGPAEFTVVASKQKAESASKAFNSSGGSATEHEIEAYRYLNNRFFRLDLPPDDIVSHDQPDFPGRTYATESIDMESVKVYRFIGAGLGQTGDIHNIIAVPDTTGRWDEDLVDDLITNDLANLSYGDLWRPLDFTTLTVNYGDTTRVVAIDLGSEMSTTDVLAVTYDVTGPSGTWRVGDLPGEDRDHQVEVDGEMYYRMKLLKPAQADPFTWQYVLRNIYSLGGTNIDATTFEFSIELNSTSLNKPDIDYTNDESLGSGLDWFRIFGLDVEDQSSHEGGDLIVDTHRSEIFDFTNGLLKFPLDFPEPFNAPPEQYAAYADNAAFNFDTSLLKDNMIPEIYDWETLPSRMSTHSEFKLVATHAAAASSFNLGVSNIEEGSETITLDNRTLTRDEDYEIDYLFGDVILKGDAAASLTPDSQISVNYQYSPFIGGGNSSLLGFNLNYALGTRNTLSTTWLYESNQVVGHKAKLGEEPSRTLVGNLNSQVAFQPGLLTDVANLISRRHTERESSVNLSGEFAVSIPNPNTFGEAYVEDYEGIDSSDLMPISRLSWSAASAPVQTEGLQVDSGDEQYDDVAHMLHHDYSPENRLDTRWFLPKDTTLRRYLNPELKEAEAREAQQVLHVHMNNADETWTGDNWGGIMRGLSKTGADLSQAQFLEFWVNDYRHEELGTERTGTLHFDFGYISEDFYWKIDHETGELQTGTYDKEDRNSNSVFESDEDTGLGEDAIYDQYFAGYELDDNPYPSDIDPNHYLSPYPRINGTLANNREDTEDLNGSTTFDTRNGYFSISVDLADSALVDVLRDYSASEVQDNISGHLAWRKYRIRLSDALEVIPAGGTTPHLGAVTHMRIWFEDDNPPPGETVRNLQFSEIKFLGSRWEREGIRKVPTADAPVEQLLDDADLPAGDEFFIGEVNNKENPDYTPPFSVYVENKIAEKETSLVIDYQNLDHQHLVRASRVISTAGADFTRYNRLIFYVYNPVPRQADMELFYRVGADTLNFYEVNYRFDQSDGERTGWREISIDMAELSNVKLADADTVTGWIEATVPDDSVDREYDVRVVGSPDLRRIKRIYCGVRNTDRTEPASGYFYFNDLRLKEVKRDIGHAERVAASVAMADVVKMDFNWSRRDADFHGLSESAGQGHTDEDWSFSANATLEDFLPLLGFHMPVTYGRQSSVSRPKYMTNSDIEIIDEALRDEQSSTNDRENYSVRFSHSRSTNPFLRYLLDPWALTVSGSRSEDVTPLQLTARSNWQGSLAYDLTLRKTRELGDLPLFGKIPVIKSVGLLPSKISASARFAGTKTQVSNYSGTADAFVDRPETETRTGNITGSVSYAPLPLADVSLSLRSTRDMFRRHEVCGFNVGAETIYNHTLQVKMNFPDKLGLPRTWYLQPVSRAYAEFKKLRPSLDFDGSFNNNHSLDVRQDDDPVGTRNISNDGDLSLRMTFPLDATLGRLLPKRVEMTDADRRRVESAQRNAPRGGEEIPDFSDHSRLQDESLTDEERQAIIDELTFEYLQEQDHEMGRRPGRGDEDAPPEDGGGGFHIPNPLSPVLAILRGVEPVQFNLTRSHAGTYGRYTGAVPMAYRLGFKRVFDTGDASYASHTNSTSYNMNMSTSTKITRSLVVDLKYAKSRSDAQTLTTHNWSYAQEWPDVNLSLSGIEKLGLLGGGKGALRQAGFQMGYKFVRKVPRYTRSEYSPKETQTISPRVNVTLQSGMTVSLNVSSGSDRDITLGALTLARNFGSDLQIRHTFRAEGLLSKLGLYRPGAQPTVNMEVALAYKTSSTERWTAGMDFAGEPVTRVGTTRMSVAPRFSYNITRNLTGAFNMSFTRSKIDETDAVTTTFSLGMEATFVF